MLYLFGKPSKRAFRRCMGRGGVGDHIFEKIAPDYTHRGPKQPILLQSKLHRLHMHVGAG